MAYWHIFTIERIYLAKIDNKKQALKTLIAQLYTNKDFLP